MFDLSNYMVHAINNKYPDSVVWAYDMFSIIMEDDYDSEYVKKEKSTLYVKQDDELILVTNTYGKDNLPLCIPTDIITIDDVINNSIKNTSTTVGRLIFNYVMLYRNFNSKITYINTEFSNKKILKTITSMMMLKDDDESKITVKEYLSYEESITFLYNYTDVYSFSTTEKSIQAPPGIQEYKKKVMKEYIDKYGEDVFKDKNRIIEVETMLAKYENDYIKDDPSYGKFVSGKVPGARKKMFVSYGNGLEFNVGDDVKYIDKDLYSGYDMTPDKLATYFNDARLGSYSRGVETQKGGVIPKISLRATNDILIVQNDCGTKLTMKILINDDNKDMYLNRYIVTSGNTVIPLSKDNIDTYINKYVNMRTPRYCITHRNYCKYCTDAIISDRENIIPILVSNEGGIVLNQSMKKMHNTTTTTTVLDMKDFIS